MLYVEKIENTYLLHVLSRLGHQPQSCVVILLCFSTGSYTKVAALSLEKSWWPKKP
jgi:hypothetical protein